MSVQLKKGDIIVFKAGDDWISKCIALFTNSDVSHASMLYSDDTIAEMYYQEIGVHKIIETSSGLEAYIMRLKPERNPEPLIKAADCYIKASTRYNFSGIVILAGLIIYREIRPERKFMHVADLILRAACAVLDKFIQEVIGKGKSMVCSQLVYQVYLDCGADYLIKGDFQLRNKPGKFRIANILEKVPRTALYNSDTMVEINQDEEELAHQLYLAMTGPEECDTVSTASENDFNINDIPESAVWFVKLLEDFLEKNGSKLPIYSLFVTPGDLVYNTTNLERLGTAKFKVNR